MRQLYLTYDKSVLKQWSVCMLVLLSGFAAAKEQTSLKANQGILTCDFPLYETDFDRSVLMGSKAILVAAYEKGKKLKVGWQMDFNDDAKAELSHWSPARFTTLFQGNVHAQIDGIVQQNPNLNDGSVALSLDYNQWTGMINTTGELTGVFQDAAPFPKIPTRVLWCLDQEPVRSWKVAYRTDIDGKSTDGSPQKVLNALRSGGQIRVGWGFSKQHNGSDLKIEHAVTPVFITAINERHFVAQLPEHIAQKSYADINQAKFETANVMWRGLLTSQGDFDAIWVDRSTGQEMRRFPQRAAVTWFVQQSDVETAKTLAVKRGVIKQQ